MSDYAAHPVAVHLREQIMREIPLVRRHWKQLLLITVWQYFHKVGTNVAYFLHRPGPLLFDLGFEFVPELGPQWQFLSEICFLVLFVSGLGTCLSPLFVRYDTPKYATIMLMRFFTAASCAQTLRVASFLSTLLPGPNYHCRPGSAEYNPPRLLEIFTRLDALKGCGDLIFSSHTIFTTLCCLTVAKYTDRAGLKRVLWALLFVLVLLVIGARKHYTVDCVVALYTTPLVWHYLDTTRPDPVVTEGYGRVPETPERGAKDMALEEGFASGVAAGGEGVGSPAIVAASDRGADRTPLSPPLDEKGEYGINVERRR